MTLPCSGAIALSQVNTELSRASNASINMNESAVRGLAGVASGAIAMSNLHCKSSVAPAGNTGWKTVTSTYFTANPLYNVSNITSENGVYAYETNSGTAGSIGMGFNMETSSIPANVNASTLNLYIRYVGYTNNATGSYVYQIRNESNYYFNLYGTPLANMTTGNTAYAFSGNYSYWGVGSAETFKSNLISFVSNPTILLVIYSPYFNTYIYYDYFAYYISWT